MIADRVEAACRALWPIWEQEPPAWQALKRRGMERALAAADALAPPPVPEDVQRAALIHKEMCDKMEAVEAMNVAVDDQAAPSADELVRDARNRFELDRHRIVSLLTDLKGGFDAVAAIPTPPPVPLDKKRLIRAAWRAWEEHNSWLEAVDAVLALLPEARAEAAEARLVRAREALEHARPFVRDAGCDEDPDAACGSCDALKLIDRALADSEPAGRAAPAAEGE